jgi:transcriptional regulator with XRE-family HTH domain
MTTIEPLAETKDTVTLSRHDFEGLLEAAEDAADLAAVDAHRAYEQEVGWERARRDYLTHDEVRRLLAGESPVKVWREKRGLPQHALAQAADVSASYLAEIEGKKKPGSTDALRRVAGILEIPMEHLVLGKPSALPGFRPFTRAEEAAKRLVRFAERGTSIDDAVDEARTILAEWLQIAKHDGVRQVHGAFWMLRSILMDIAAGLSKRAREQEQNDPAAARQLRRMADALEGAVTVLGDESRQLKSKERGLVASGKA